MINEYYAKTFCCEDLSNIENYNKAIADTTQTWDCHHRGEILPCGRFSRDDLKKFGLYYSRPASELIFLTRAEHISLHNRGVPKSEATKKALRLSEALKKAHAKKVLQYDLNGNFIAEFKSQCEAAASMGLKSQANLCIAMKNGLPYRNFIWKYSIAKSK